MAEVIADMRQELTEDGKLIRNRIIIGENASKEMIAQMAGVLGVTVDELKKLGGRR